MEKKALYTEIDCKHARSVDNEMCVTVSEAFVHSNWDLIADVAVEVALVVIDDATVDVAEEL